MVLFHQQATKAQQSCFDSEDLPETLTSTLEIIAERTQEARSSSEGLILLVVKPPVHITLILPRVESQQSGIKN